MEQKEQEWTSIGQKEQAEVKDGSNANTDTQITSNDDSFELGNASIASVYQGFVDHICSIYPKRKISLPETPPSHKRRSVLNLASTYASNSFPELTAAQTEINRLLQLQEDLRLMKMHWSTGFLPFVKANGKTQGDEYTYSLNKQVSRKQSLSKEKYNPSIAIKSTHKSLNTIDYPTSQTTDKSKPVGTFKSSGHLVGRLHSRRNSLEGQSGSIAQNTQPKAAYKQVAPKLIEDVLSKLQNKPDDRIHVPLLRDLPMIQKQRQDLMATRSSTLKRKGLAHNNSLAHVLEDGNSNPKQTQATSNGQPQIGLRVSTQIYEAYLGGGPLAAIPSTQSYATLVQSTRSLCSCHNSRRNRRPRLLSLTDFAS